VQVYLSQYGGGVVVWTINKQAAAKSGRDVNLTVVERGPIVTVTAPALLDRLKVIVVSYTNVIRRPIVSVIVSKWPLLLS
jgi:hypothetical protein